MSPGSFNPFQTASMPSDVRCEIPAPLVGSVIATRAVADREFLRTYGRLALVHGPVPAGGCALLSTGGGGSFI